MMGVCARNMSSQRNFNKLHCCIKLAFHFITRSCHANSLQNINISHAKFLRQSRCSTHPLCNELAYYLTFSHFFGRVRNTAILASSCLLDSVEQLGSHCRGSHEIYYEVYISIYMRFVWQSVEKKQHASKSDKNNGYFTWRPPYLFGKPMYIHVNCVPLNYVVQTVN